MSQDRVRYLIDNFAATPEELSVLGAEEFSDTAFYIQLLKLRGRKYEEDLYCLRIMEECGKAGSDVRKEFSFMRSLDPSIEISMESYYKYGAYYLDALNDKKAALQWIDKLNRYHLLRDRIIQKIEIERMPFSSFEKELEEARIMLSEMLSESRKKELIEAINYIRPDLSENTAEYDKVAVDMELSIDVLGFIAATYTAYHFWEKTVPQRLECISDRLRKKIGELLNSAEGFDILNNKYLAYQALKPLYGRKIRQMNADKGFPAFEEAFRENSVLVKKNNFQSLGKEVERIEVTENTDLHALYERIAANGRYFILEDLIRPHPELERLNPDSINTIRIVMFRDREGPVVLDSFLRIGRKGSFVDNVGSGGIFVHVDPATGITEGCGLDKKGYVYRSHPDHGYPCSGIRMPLWNEALEIAKEAALRIPGARYAGWDITYTDEDRWILIEGNGIPMYEGQTSRDFRKRKEILEAIHYEELIGSETALRL